MRRQIIIIALALALLLVACEGYSQTGASSKMQSDMNGGDLAVRVRKASGTAEQDIELDDGGASGLILEADVTLSVEKGIFRIELLGEDGVVTLELEARDGAPASGHGQMVIDSFGDATYRVTAEEAENVEYTISWTYR
jgi:hypothetical protein